MPKVDGYLPAQQLGQGVGCQSFAAGVDLVNAGQRRTSGELTVCPTPGLVEVIDVRQGAGRQLFGPYDPLGVTQSEGDVGR